MSRTIRIVILNIPEEREKEAFEWLYDGMKKGLFTTSDTHMRYDDK